VSPGANREWSCPDGQFLLAQVARSDSFLRLLAFITYFYCPDRIAPETAVGVAFPFRQRLTPRQQIRPALPRSPQRLFQPPATNLPRGDRTSTHPAPAARRTPRAACSAGNPANPRQTNPVVPKRHLQHPRQLADDGINQGHRRQFRRPKARNPRSKFLHRHSARSAARQFLHSGRKEGSALLHRVASCITRFMGERRTLRREVDDPALRQARLTLLRLGCAIAFSSGPGCITMPGPPPKGRSSTRRQAFSAKSRGFQPCHTQRCSSSARRVMPLCVTARTSPGRA
jgi:hypothetical protein